jgi:hypothetical protein
MVRRLRGGGAVCVRSTLTPSCAAPGRPVAASAPWRPNGAADPGAGDAARRSFVRAGPDAQIRGPSRAPVPFLVPVRSGVEGGHRGESPRRGSGSTRWPGRGWIRRRRPPHGPRCPCGRRRRRTRGCRR